MEAKIDDGSQLKIRKRGCSSSSSSSLVHKCRFKRAILIGKRGGSTTPVPTWKMGAKSPSLEMENGELCGFAASNKNNVGKIGKEMVVSARKLAASLWEMDEVPSPRVRKDLEEEKKEMRSRERLQSGSLPPHLSDPSHSPPGSERIDRFRGGSHRRRISAVSRKLQLTTDPNLGGVDSISTASLMEIETQHQNQNPCWYSVGIKTRLKDVSNGLITSKELLKALNRIWGLDENYHTSSISLVSALRVELDRARLQVDQLIQDQRSTRNEINHLVKHFAEEKAGWRSKERERIHGAISSIAAELEVEKKLRRQTERLNKKLGKELAETKTSLLKARKELKSEKRARDVLEQVCDELARGIGEDRAEVEELKRESAKVRQEVEKEREMLQLADVLREERVQMKLSEAKYHFEEKNAAVDKLRGELESYLRNKVGREKVDDSLNSDVIKELRSVLRKAGLDSCENGEKELGEGEVEDGEEPEDENSAESDLHSIELNVDGNSRSYEWNFPCGEAAQDDSKRNSVEVFKGRKSLSEKIQWANISLNRGALDKMECEFDTNCQENLTGTDGGLLTDVASKARRDENADEKNRYRSEKGLRDNALSGSKLASAQGSAQESPRVKQRSTLKARPAQR